MECEGIRAVLHSQLDGELPPGDDREVLTHLAACADCAREWDEVHALKKALREALPRTPPPPELRLRVQTALRQEAGKGPSPGPWRWTLALLLLIGPAVGTGAWLLVGPDGYFSKERVMAREVGAMHRQSGAPCHACGQPLDMAARLGSELPFRPVLPDLGTAGFVFLGAHADEIGGRSVAVCTYRGGMDLITLVIRQAEAGAAEEIRVREEQGLQVARWSLGGLEYWAAARLGSTYLQTFAELALTTLRPCCHPGVTPGR